LLLLEKNGNYLKIIRFLKDINIQRLKLKFSFSKDPGLHKILNKGPNTGFMQPNIDDIDLCSQNKKKIEYKYFNLCKIPVSYK